MRKLETDMHRDSISKAVGQEIVTKTTDQSRLTLCYNFTKDSNLRDLYIDHTGNILIGKLLEDLDALAGNIASDHCEDENPLTKRLHLVTASVDEIIQQRPISITDDLLLTGQIAWVGKTSLDVIVEIHRAADIKTGDGELTPVLQAACTKSRLLTSFFTYVARNKDSNKAAPVNLLKLSNPQEEALFKLRNDAANMRKSVRNGEVPTPNSEKLQKLIEAGSAMQDMPALAHPNSVLMRYTGLENSVVCQPQNVNTSGRVFGGFIS